MSIEFTILVYGPSSFFFSILFSPEAAASPIVVGLLPTWVTLASSGEP